MKESLLEKIELIRKINTDDSNFIIKVYEMFEKKSKEVENKKTSTSIILDNDNIKSQKNVINLDKIWAKPYFYTKMRIRFEEMLKQISNANTSDILQNPAVFCSKVIFNEPSYCFNKPEDCTDIVEYIQALDEIKKINPEENFNYIFTAKAIDEETLFKEEQLKIAIKIINIDNLHTRNELIYDEICNFLQKDFVSNNFCDFKNNKCVAQRNHQFYPINRKNGCCFTSIRQCPHLKNGICDTECLPCRLFSCPYLTKRGLGYWANDFILLKAFLSKKQRKHLIFDFYQPKEKILKKM